MRTRPRISTSEIHFIISKTVSAVLADATEVPTSRRKICSTNGLADTGPQSGSNFKKNFGNQFFHLHYDQKNTLNPLVKSVFKSVHNHRRYLRFCDPHVCSIKYAATQRLQLRAWPILCTGLRPVQLFLVNVFFLFVLFFLCIAVEFRRIKLNILNSVTSPAWSATWSPTVANGHPARPCGVMGFAQIRSFYGGVE